MTEVWTKWEGEVIGGVFPLRRLVSGSDHSGVFLTEIRTRNVADAAIKILPTDPAMSDAQLSRWRIAATLSHPHLVRLFDMGRCQRGGDQFLFVVMEYAEQALSQILPHRSLTADEMQEMLRPTLEALDFLHGQKLVHGGLKPPNFLVVNDQLKLASDSIFSAGGSATGIVRSSMYDPPEAKTRGYTAAGDIWALGVTMIEALTQHLPAWPDERADTVTLPAGFPAAFAETVRRCLSRNPANRPSVTDLRAQFERLSQAPVVPIPESVVRTDTARATSRLVPSFATLLLVFVAVWAGLRLFHGRADPRQPTAITSRSSAPQAAPPGAAARAADSGALATPKASSFSNDSPAVLHAEIPAVPRSASDTIHGHFNVAVRVTVDHSGNVIDETLESPGPSKYFARLATTAARQWKFARADTQHSREWLVWFEFSRDGTTAHADAPEP